MIASLGSMVKTLFLFTKSDLKTTIMPLSLLGFSSGPLKNTSHALQAVVWLWIHLLQFTASNQSTAPPVEDKLNKADRPIPSGRVARSQVIILRWLMIPFCLALSSMYSGIVVVASLAVIICTFWYNEFGGSNDNWFIRNLVNGVGFGAFASGAILIASENRYEMDRIAIRSLLVLISLYTTTTHTQDFKDVEGDSRFNRSTVPLIMPRIARHSVLIGVVGWSLLLMNIWNLDLRIGVPLCLLAAWVGVRFMMKTGKTDDQISFYWYNFWLCLTQVLPWVYRVNLNQGEI